MSKNKCCDEFRWLITLLGKHLEFYWPTKYKRNINKIEKEIIFDVVQSFVGGWTVDGHTDGTKLFCEDCKNLSYKFLTQDMNKYKYPKLYLLKN